MKFIPHFIANMQNASRDQELEEIYQSHPKNTAKMHFLSVSKAFLDHVNTFSLMNQIHQKASGQHETEFVMWFISE